jgi:two-component system NtrC family sensor kinase
MLAKELRDAKEHLEDTVEQRTQDLATAIDRLTKAQAMAEQSGKLATVGEIAAGIIHELSNPLSTMLGFSQLLTKDPSKDKVKEYIAVIMKQATRMQGIVKNLLAISRRAKPELQPTPLSDIIGEVGVLVAYELRSHNVKLDVRVDKGLPQVMVDSAQMQHVFINLIVNACQAMEGRDGSQIIIDARPEGKYLKIRVSDNGPGIPAEVARHVFEPFFTTKPEGKGTGLGLAIARSILEDHGGTIAVGTSREGGAEFALDLPLASQPHINPSEKIDGKNLLGDLRTRRVLVVDDESDMRSYLKNLLEVAGCEPETAANGVKALEILKHSDFDVLVTDMVMPTLGGAELLRSAKKMGRDFTGRVVLMSGSVHRDRIQKVADEFRAPILDKPFSGSSLIALIAGLTAKGH